MTDVLADLQILLDRERRVLLSGDYRQVSDVIDEKVRLSAHLALRSGGIGRDQAQALKEQAAQNHTLLEAAQRGLEAARQTLQMLTPGGVELKTYDKRGNPGQIRNSGAGKTWRS